MRYNSCTTQFQLVKNLELVTLILTKKPQKTKTTTTKQTPVNMILNNSFGSIREQALHDKLLSVREMRIQSHSCVLFTWSRSCWSHKLLEGNSEELLEARLGPL